MKNLMILTLLIFATSCKTTKDMEAKNQVIKIDNKTKPSGGITERIHDPIIIKAKIARNDAKNKASVQILGSKISENTLNLKIGYSGGCSKHKFEFIGNPMISKSLPPIRSAELIHYANGDTCREYIEQELIIDISELAYLKEGGSSIKLNFADTTLLYTYTEE